MTAFGYDAAGRRLAVTNALGKPEQMAMTYAYDANGNQTVMTDAKGNSATNVYDALNRVAEVDYADGTKSLTGYDAAGRRTSQTDQATNTTFFGYDGAGRLVAVTNALNQVTRYQYDEAGNQTSQTDARNSVTLFEYDGLGRRTKRTLPALQYETFGYDLAGNMTLHTDFNGVSVTNQYDLLNRLTSRVDLADPYNPLETYTYTRSGQRLGWQCKEPAAANAYFTNQYDLRDRLVAKSASFDDLQYTLWYSYDANGNVTGITSSTGGTKVGYAYDALNRLVTVSDANLGTTVTNTTYQYDAVGNLKGCALPNGLTNLYRYDKLNRLTNLAWNLGSTVVASYRYQLGPAGNRTNVVGGGSISASTIAYTYDSIYRLKSETLPASSANYGYDEVGNRLSLVLTNAWGGLTNQGCGYDPNDLIATNVYGPVDVYDANGNTCTNGANTYQYDEDNRLVGAVVGGTTLKFDYDADGNRIFKEGVVAPSVYYVVDDRNPTGYPQVLEEWHFESYYWTNTHAYTWGLALVSQRLADGSAWFYGMDGHGSTRFLTDTNGAVGNTYSYDAFGNLTASTGTVPNNYLYTGQQFDPDLGMYYLRARYYQPLTGRFWTRDTTEGNRNEPRSLHKYLYCQANPINGVDPSGLAMSWESYMGYAAEEAIEDEYEATHLGDKVAYGSQQPFGTSFLKPDIFNTSKKTFLEIKPISGSGITRGLAKLAVDEGAFGPLTLKYNPEASWQPRSCLLVTTDGETIFVINVGGLVLYKDINEIKWELITVASIKGAKDLLPYLTRLTLADAQPIITRMLVRAGLAETAEVGAYWGIASENSAMAPGL